MTEDKLVTVTAAILEHNGRILVAQRKASDRLSGMLEVPGGKLENGETLKECLKRELREEFGIEVSVGHFVAESIHHYDHISICLITYAATLLGGLLEPTDHDDYRWVTIPGTDRYGPSKMVEKAVQNAEKLQTANVAFRLGQIKTAAAGRRFSGCRHLKLRDQPLRTSRPFSARSYRVLKPGGRMVISDVLRSEEIPQELKNDPAVYNLSSSDSIRSPPSWP